MNRALSSICMLLTCSCMLPAESGTADFSVYIHLPMESNFGTAAIGPKLRFGKAKIPVSHVRRVADLPIHVVFVIDVATHQLSLIPLELNYIEKICSHITAPDATFTVVTTSEPSEVLADSEGAQSLTGRLSGLDPKRLDGKGRQFSLQRALVDGSKPLSGTPVQELVVVSDDDDDLNGRQRKALEEIMSDSHVRAFSLLVAYRPVYGIRAKVLGVELNKLSNATGGEQFATNWDHRTSDGAVLHELASALTAGELVSFTLPATAEIHRGKYQLTVDFGSRGTRSRSSTFIVK